PEILNASTEGEINAAFADLAQLRASAVIVAADAFFMSRRNQIVALAAHYAVPAIYFRAFVVAGGLMSHQPALLSHDFPRFYALPPGLTPGLAGRNRVGGTMGAMTHWRAAYVNWFTRRGWRKRYRHRYARACAPILSVGSGAHSRDHAVDRTGGSDLGAVPH